MVLPTTKIESEPATLAAGRDASRTDRARRQPEAFRVSRIRWGEAPATGTKRMPGESSFT